MQYFCSCFLEFFPEEVTVLLVEGIRVYFDLEKNSSNIRKKLCFFSMWVGFFSVMQIMLFLCCMCMFGEHDDLCLWFSCSCLLLPNGIVWPIASAFPKLFKEGEVVCIVTVLAVFEHPAVRKSAKVWVHFADEKCSGRGVGVALPVQSCNKAVHIPSVCR